MRKHIANALVFLVSTTALGCYNLIADGKPTVSEVENRELAKAPDFSFSALASGEYFREMDAYFSDNFIFRENMVLASSYIKESWRIPAIGGGTDIRIIYSVDGDDYDPSDAQPGDADGFEAGGIGGIGVASAGAAGGDRGASGDMGAGSDATAAGRDASSTSRVAMGEGWWQSDTGGQGGLGGFGDTYALDDGAREPADADPSMPQAAGLGSADAAAAGMGSADAAAAGQGTAEAAAAGQGSADAAAAGQGTAEAAAVGQGLADVAASATADPGAGTPDAAASGPGAAAGASAAPADGDSVGGTNSDETARKVGGLIIQGDRLMEIYGFYAPSCDLYADIINRYAQMLAPQEPQSPGAKQDGGGMRGVRVISILAPTSVEFNLDEEYKKLSSPQKRTVEYIDERLNDGIIKVPAYDELESHKGEYLYFRTDHHWTALGSYYAYLAFADAIGAEPVRLEDCASGVVDGFLGSLYGKNPVASIKKRPDQVQWYEPPHETAVEVFASYGAPARPGKLIDLAYEKTANKYQIFLGGDLPYVRIKTDVDNGKKILVVKESYGLAFVPWLVANYEEVHVVDPRHFSDGIVSLARAEGVDDVLFLNGMHMSGAKSYADALLQNLY